MFRGMVFGSFRFSLLIALLLLTLFVTCEAQQPFLEWVRKYPDTINQSGSSYAMVLDDSANIYVTGRFNVSNSSYYCTIKYNSIGVKQWLSTFSSGPGGNTAYAIAVDTVHNVFVTGGARIADYCTLKYNSTGIQEWVQFYDGPVHGIDQATAIAVDKAGNVYVTGYSSISGTYGYVYTTIKYSSDGRQLWVRLYGDIYSSTSANAIVVDDSCNVYVTGEASSGSPAAVTIKYDSSGTQVWVQVYHGITTGRTGANGIALDRNNNVYITGYSAAFNRPSDYFTIKYSSSGIEQWVRRYSVDSIISRNSRANSISIYNEGSVYVSGWGDSSGLRYFCTIKYTFSGEQLWVRLYSFGNASQQTSMALDSRSNVYVTGAVVVNSSYAYGTIKYDSSGNILWAVTFTAYGLYDEPRTVKVDSNNNLYLTGTSSRGGGLTDFCTVKYSQPVGIVNNNNHIPVKFNLYQNYPNPFNQFTIISYQLPITSDVTIIVYDILGRQATVLADEKQNAGEYSIRFDATKLSSGVYYYTLKAGEVIITKKLVLIK